MNGSDSIRTTTGADTSAAPHDQAPANSVVDEIDERRFALRGPSGELLSVADYRRSGNTISVTHVGTPPELRGRGLADELMHGVAAQIEAQQLTIEPICSYAAAWMADHPEHESLLA